MFTEAVSKETPTPVNKFKKRMLSWNNPVEFVNNMYGSHPDDENDREYFEFVYKINLD
ncbi:MAG: hypothetical protein WCW64_00925 [Phycisphaerae bacterium]|jgi:hypothetical protein